MIPELNSFVCVINTDLPSSSTKYMDTFRIFTFGRHGSYKWA